MSVELTAALCSDVAAALGLPHPGLVEKDFHVVRALRALGAVESKGASLVFGGGTSLCRAFRLIERMSEDIDLRIVSREALSQGERKAFRGKVTECLVAAGFASADAAGVVGDVKRGGNSASSGPALGSLKWLHSTLTLISGLLNVLSTEWVAFDESPSAPAAPETGSL